MRKLIKLWIFYYSIKNNNILIFLLKINYAASYSKNKFIISTFTVILVPARYTKTKQDINFKTNYYILQAT